MMCLDRPEFQWILDLCNSDLSYFDEISLPYITIDLADVLRTKDNKIFEKILTSEEYSKILKGRSIYPTKEQLCMMWENGLISFKEYNKAVQNIEKLEKKGLYYE